MSNNKNTKLYFNIHKIFYFTTKGDNGICFEHHELKEHNHSNVHAELALKEEELKKTRQILKEVTDEKEELLMKVKYVQFSNFFQFSYVI